MTVCMFMRMTVVSMFVMMVVVMSVSMFMCVLMHGSMFMRVFSVRMGMSMFMMMMFVVVVVVMVMMVVMIKVTSDSMVFFTVFHMHIEVGSPNATFCDTVYMKMIAVERNSLKGFFKMLAVGS